jgi:hypothetical protein
MSQSNTAFVETDDRQKQHNAVTMPKSNIEVYTSSRGEVTRWILGAYPRGRSACHCRLKRDTGADESLLVRGKSCTTQSSMSVCCTKICNYAKWALIGGTMAYSLERQSRRLLGGGQQLSSRLHSLRTIPPRHTGFGEVYGCNPPNERPICPYLLTFCTTRPPAGLVQDCFPPRPRPRLCVLASS